MQIRILNSATNAVIDSWDTSSPNIDGFLNFISKWGMDPKVSEIIAYHREGKVKQYDCLEKVTLTYPTNPK